MQSRVRALLVAPALDGPATGGTLYNRQLLAAVDREWLELEPVALREAPARSLALAPARTLDALWIDSLYLDAVPQLRAAVAPGTKLGLLLHYLPSLLEQPSPRQLSDLSGTEQRALAAVDLVVTPSATLRELVQSLSPGSRCASIEPGVAVMPATPPPRERACLMVCNVTENKGVLPLLEALAAQATPADAFPLRIAGRLDLEPAYAARCGACVEAHPWLRAHVRWLGGVAPYDVLDHIARASVLVSASRMESYGMALAEARAHGTPIVARAGGHVAAHVKLERGGELVADESALAAALLELLRRPAELARRLQLAAANPLLRRWADVAREFEHINLQLTAASSELRPG